jgi:hypothetical protein
MAMDQFALVPLDVCISKSDKMDVNCGKSALSHIECDVAGQEIHQSAGRKAFHM